MLTQFIVATAVDMGKIPVMLRAHADQLTVLVKLPRGDCTHFLMTKSITVDGLYAGFWPLLDTLAAFTPAVSEHVSAPVWVMRVSDPPHEVTENSWQASASQNETTTSDLWELLAQAHLHVEVDMVW